MATTRQTAPAVFAPLFAMRGTGGFISNAGQRVFAIGDVRRVPAASVVAVPRFPPVFPHGRSIAVAADGKAAALTSR